MQDRMEALTLGTIYRVEQWNTFGGWDVKLTVNDREVAISHATTRHGWHRVIEIQNNTEKIIWPRNKV